MSGWRRGERENFGRSWIGRRYDYCDQHVDGGGEEVCIVNSHKPQGGQQLLRDEQRTEKFSTCLWIPRCRVFCFFVRWRFVFFI